MIKNKYKVWITTGGVPEQPFFKDEDVRYVDAYSADEAIEIWVKWKGLDKGKQSYLLERGKDGKGWSYYYTISCEQVNSTELDKISVYNDLIKVDYDRYAYSKCISCGATNEDSYLTSIILNNNLKVSICKRCKLDLQHKLRQIRL